MVFYWIVLPIAWLVWHLLWRIEVTGREYLIGDEAGRGYVVAANHISDIDPVFIAISVFSMRRMCIIAKEELFRNPVIGWCLRQLGAVPIARGKGDTKTLDKVTAQVEKGHGLLIFAEGTRSKDGRIGKIKSGAFVVASAAGADMIPCRIFYDTPNGRMRLFCRVRVCFGPHIPAADLHIEDPRHSMAQIRALKQRLHEAWDTLYDAHRFPGAPTSAQLNAPKPAPAKPAAPAAKPAADAPATDAPATDAPAADAPAEPAAPAPEAAPETEPAPETAPAPEAAPPQSGDL